MTSPGGSLRFSSARRHIADETKLQLISVGVDIGSSTSLLVFSRLELELIGNRYVPVKRTILCESDILLTPYADESSIDAEALGRFIANQYQAAGIRREEVDTGAVILTGVALLRRNARAIAELFAEEAGRFVAVSAGHNLEATMAAYGSGAAAISGKNQNAVLNLDIGGGTTKLALCVHGELTEIGALDVGARVVAVDGDGVVVRLEASGRRMAEALGFSLAPGRHIEREALECMAGYAADRIMEAIGLRPLTEATRGLWLTPQPTLNGTIDGLTFSGGVSEYLYGRQNGSFGDLGVLLAREIRARVQESGVPVLPSTQGIRATVIGASQYTVQVSGDTIFITPEDAVPIRSVPVIVPRFKFGREPIDQERVRIETEQALRRLDLDRHEGPLAVAIHWEGLASFARLNALCQGILQALSGNLTQGNPLVLVCDGDVGGLLGIHLKEESHFPNPVVSIDGVDLREFDFIDVGSLIPTSGAAPVVIKSLVFPGVQQEVGSG